MRLIPDHEVRLTGDEYAKLLEAFKRAERIQADREDEIEQHRQLLDHGRAEAIFRTRDQLVCVGALPSKSFLRKVVRPCISPIRGIGNDSDPGYKPTETREYEFTGRYLCGKPIYEEV